LSSGAWGREEHPDLAVDKILEAAEKAFVELGVSAAGMAEIANYAGCSRGTLYRYFKNRHELHLAYVQRTSLAIQRDVHDRVASIEDTGQRLTEFILCTVQAVRDNPATAAWFAPGVSGLAARMSRSTELVETLTTAFVSERSSAEDSRADDDLRQQWLVRVVVSLLTDPGENDAQERSLIERFVVPAVLAEDQSASE
jgi:AcrR family transcriptional regulator